jgi:hypothetical protein
MALAAQVAGVARLSSVGGRSGQLRRRSAQQRAQRSCLGPPVIVFAAAGPGFSAGHESFAVARESAGVATTRSAMTGWRCGTRRTAKCRAPAAVSGIVSVEPNVAAVQKNRHEQPRVDHRVIGANEAMVVDGAAAARCNRVPAQSIWPMAPTAQQRREPTAGDGAADCGAYDRALLDEGSVRPGAVHHDTGPQ